MERDEWGSVLTVGIIVVVGWWAVTTYQQTSTYKERVAEQAALEKLERTPRVVSEKDGCQVYSFRDEGRVHYFTRCPEVTITETNMQKSCGRNCTSIESTSIITPNTK